MPVPSKVWVVYAVLNSPYRVPWLTRDILNLIVGTGRWLKRYVGRRLTRTLVSDFVIPDSLLELMTLLIFFRVVINVWSVSGAWSLNSPPRVNDLTSDTLNLIVGIWEMIDVLRWEMLDMDSSGIFYISWLFCGVGLNTWRAKRLVNLRGWSDVHCFFFQRFGKCVLTC